MVLTAGKHTGLCATRGEKPGVKKVTCVWPKAATCVELLMDLLHTQKSFPLKLRRALRILS